MVELQRGRQREREPQVLSAGLLPQVDVNASGSHHLHAVGAGGVWQGERLCLPIQRVESQHWEEVGRWVLLN